METTPLKLAAAHADEDPGIVISARRKPQGKIFVSLGIDTERHINRILEESGNHRLRAERYQIHNFFGIWLKVSPARDQGRKHASVASPNLTTALNTLGLVEGDEVLVVTRIGILSKLVIVMVAPITDSNRHLDGRWFTSPQLYRNPDLLVN